MMQSEQNQLPQLSLSSQEALAWAVMRSTQRASGEREPRMAVSAADIIVGIWLAHPTSSEPYQLFEHFRLPLEPFYHELKFQGGFAPDTAPSSVDRYEGLPPFDPEGQRVWEKSLELWQRYQRKDEQRLSLRYLFAGILATSNLVSDLLQKLIATRAPVSFEALVTAYHDFLSPSNEQRDFKTFLAEKFPLSAKNGPDGARPLPAEIRFAVSGFNADVRTERDLVGIGAEVDAFAYLIAAKALKPPLAIGLFGDWGSGKSYFMESLRQRIQKLTADAQQSGQPQSKISIYKYIAQIEFNAWHYVEGELWASLVEHIFRNLKVSSKDEPTLLQKRQQMLIDKLNEVRRGQLAAQERKEQLEAELSKAQELVRQSEQARKEALEKIEELKAGDVLKAIVLTNQERAEIHGTLSRLGVAGLGEGVADLIRGTDELLDVLKRGNALTTRLREHGWEWVAALILVTAIGPMVSLVLSQIQHVSAITNLLTSLSAFLGGLVVILKQGTAWLSGMLTRVEGAKSHLDSKREEEARRQAKAVETARNQYAQAVAKYDLAKKEEDDKKRQIEELEKELRQVTPGRVLVDFISERVGSQDYRKHLGIAALIRNDFEQLSRLIADQNDRFERDEQAEGEEESLLINRIVLYIDDLDRCPPERVVQVLQAVHLLLAFPLFVVVVAVDARWLAQSLQKHYQELLAPDVRRNGVRLPEDFGRQASPQDYLEKIFQIPFWVRPLPEMARIRIVTDLVDTSLVAPAVGDAGDQDQPQHVGRGDQGPGGDEENNGGIWDPSERIRPLNLLAETDLAPKGLDIESMELRFMDDLRSLLGQTPRSVKRFVNIYRLIKVVSLDRIATFVTSAPDADFKLVLFLLAVLTGLPAVSRELFWLLRTSCPDAEAKEAGVQGSTASASRSLAEVLTALRVVGARPLAAAASGDLVPESQAGEMGVEAFPGYSSEMRDHETYAANSDLDRLESWLKKQDEGSWLKFDAAVLATWVPLVVRFSYRMEEQ